MNVVKLHIALLTAIMLIGIGISASAQETTKSAKEKLLEMMQEPQAAPKKTTPAKTTAVSQSKINKTVRAQQAPAVPAPEKTEQEFKNKAQLINTVSNGNIAGSSLDASKNDSSVLIFSGLLLAVIIIFTIIRRNIMKWFYDLKIGTKLISAFVLVALIGAFIGYNGIVSLYAADESDTILYERNLVPVAEMGTISTAFHRLRVNLLELTLSTTAAEKADYTKRIADRRKEIAESVEKVDKAIFSEDVRKIFNEFKDARKDYIESQDQVLGLCSSNRGAEARVLLATVAEKARKPYQAKIDELIETFTKRGKIRADENTVNAEAAVQMMLIFSVFGFIISIVLGIVISRIISKPLQRGVEMMKELSQGHIEARLNITTKDEVGILAQTMDEFANKLQTKVVAVMDHVAAGSLTDEVDDSDKADKISPALKQIIASLRSLQAEAKRLTEAAVAGKLATRGDVTKYNGAYKEIVQGVNETLDGVIGICCGRCRCNGFKTWQLWRIIRLWVFQCHGIFRV